MYVCLRVGRHTVYMRSVCSTFVVKLSIPDNVAAAQVALFSVSAQPGARQEQVELDRCLVFLGDI